MRIFDDRLENSEIHKELKKLSFSGGDKLEVKRIDEIIQEFWFYDFYNSLISFPPYLKYLKSFLRKQKNRRFSRPNFYQFFLEKAVSKRQALALQKLAAALELMQVNDRPVQELDKLANKLKIDLKTSDLVEKNILKQFKHEDGSEAIGFYHHTIQEFLATQFILSTKTPITTAQSFMILNQEGIVAFKPSWYGTLRFLLESKVAKDFVEWIVDFAVKNKATVDDAFSDVITRVDSKITPGLKTKIFDLIYDSYFEKQLWIPIWARLQLAQFCNKQHLQRFKKDIKPTKNETETFVHRGNVAAVIDGILQNNPKILSKAEKTYWKNQLVRFANDDNQNGVLQRHSLEALINYKDAKLIPQVAKAYDHPDSVVQETFLQFCYHTAPNDRQTIDFLVKSIGERGQDIYGRHGLYEIKSKRGISYLLEKFAQNERFLQRFLDRESIFDAKEGKGDQLLIEHIRAVSDGRIVKKIKAVIRKAATSIETFQSDRSHFIQELALIVRSWYPSYLLEILEEIKREKPDEKLIWQRLFSYEGIFAVLFTRGNLAPFVKRLKQLTNGWDTIFTSAINAAHREAEKGEIIFQEAVKRKFLSQPYKKPAWGEAEKESKSKTYKRFQELLEPEPGKYFAKVFQYYLENRKTVETLWTEAEKKRLIKLAIEEGLKKIDPRKIQVRIKDLETESKSFSISSVHAYFGDIVRVGQLLFPKKLKEYGQQIINFIPYAYSDDQQTILDVIKKVTDTELANFVNKVYRDKNDHRRYLIPSSYIYLLKEYVNRGCRLPSSVKVLQSFIGDKYISLSDQRLGIETLGELAKEIGAPKKTYFQKVFRTSKEEQQSIAANTILISVFKDEKAIDWRFGQIKERFKTIDQEFEKAEVGKQEPGKAYWVSDVENELDELHFARPLISLKDTKYLGKFLTLLKFSLQRQQEAESEPKQKYISYLWRIVIEYVEGLKEKGSFDPVVKLEEWAEKNASTDEANWFKGRIDRLYKAYIDFISTDKGIEEIALQIRASEAE